MDLVKLIKKVPSYFWESLLISSWESGERKRTNWREREREKKKAEVKEKKIKLKKRLRVRERKREIIGMKEKATRVRERMNEKESGRKTEIDYKFIFRK